MGRQLRAQSQRPRAGSGRHRARDQRHASPARQRRSKCACTACVDQRSCEAGGIRSLSARRVPAATARRRRRAEHRKLRTRDRRRSRICAGVCRAQRCALPDPLLQRNAAPSQVHDRTIAAARRALELDSTLAEAHTSLAISLWLNTRPDEAEREFRLAVALDPNDQGRALSVWSVPADGRPTEGIARRVRPGQAERSGFAAHLRVVILRALR